MIDRVLVMALAGSAALGMLLVWEWETGSAAPQSPISTVPIRPEERADPRIQRAPVEELVAATLGRPLFAPTRRPPDRVGDKRDSDPQLPNLRLTGIVIEPQHHIAIFAVPGAKSLLRSEGESLNEWRLDTIAPREVTLTGAAGSTTLQPKTDPNIVRPTQTQLQGAPQGTPQGAPRATPAARRPEAAGRPPAPLRVPQSRR
jgi:hypothetical protein